MDARTPRPGIGLSDPDAGRLEAGPALAAIGWLVILAAFAVYVASSWRYDAGRPDFFYLADAFLHGRLWLDHPFGPWDNVVVDNRVYVPFAPFPSIALTPLVVLIGPVTADQWEQVIDSTLAAAVVGLWWWLMSRLGVRSLADRLWLVLLLGFSTPIWWVTTRGGVWHTGHLAATMVTLGALIEAWGRRRSWLLGLLVGAGFLSRAPLALTAPFFAWIASTAHPPRPGTAGDGRGARGPSMGWGWHRRSCSPSGTTPRGSGRPWSPVTPWPRCRTGWSVNATSACSASTTWR